MIVPAVLAGNIAYANEATVATDEHIAGVMTTNNSATGASQNDKDDWNHQKELIESREVKVLIQPVKDKPGNCVIGLDGFPQKYELPADERTLDGELEKAEWIPNLSVQDSNRFYFPCDLKAETPKPIPPIPVPPVPEAPKLAPLIFSPRVSYLRIWGAEDKTYGNSGILDGASLSVIIQPRITDWYFGGRVFAHGNRSSTFEDVNVPATEGPLAGQLTMQGRKDYSLETLGIGTGPLVGYTLVSDEKGRWGIGVELENGLMHDWVTRKFAENSAHYINGNKLEGSDTSNHTDNVSTGFYGYAMGGLRLKAPSICAILSGGARTDLDQVNGMFSVGIAYCPDTNKK